MTTSFTKVSAKKPVVPCSGDRFLWQVLWRWPLCIEQVTYHLLSPFQPRVLVGNDSPAKARAHAVNISDF